MAVLNDYAARLRLDEPDPLAAWDVQLGRETNRGGVGPALRSWAS
jgi:hypothetical protein